MNNKKYGIGFKITEDSMENEKLISRWHKDLIRVLKVCIKEHKISHPEITITGTVQEKEKK